MKRLVSNFGRILSIQKYSTKVTYSIIIIKSTTHYGYFRLKTQKKQYLLHRLIAIAFISNPENKPHINHINGIKKDNRIDNLEWVTGSENLKKSWEIGLCKPATKETIEKSVAPRRIPIKGISILDGHVITFYSQLEAYNKKFYYTKKHIKNNTPYKGYMWSFLPKYIHV